jgi:hypothetical protein
MSRRLVLLGAGIGVALGVVILALLGPDKSLPRDDPPAGPILSDCDGQVRELVIQYVPAAAAIVSPVYRQFLAHLPADVTVHVVCPDRAAFDDLQARVGRVTCRLSAVLTGHPMTSWARDRWLALSPAGEHMPATVLCPRGEEGAEGWPDRAGDHRIAADLAAAIGPRVARRQSPLYFDGGDFVADARTAFVAPSVATRNIQQTVPDRQELLKMLRQALNRNVVLLDRAPPHHAGMYMMPIGKGTVLVGDPRLARQAVPDSKMPPGIPPCGADFSAQTQELFDAVAARCARADYKIIRIPIVPGRDGRSYVTYLNVIIDDRSGKRTVYMPVYRGAESLNEAAAAVWRNAGYEVRLVDCTSAYTYSGTLRCLVNVLRR